MPPMVFYLNLDIPYGLSPQTLYYSLNSDSYEVIDLFPVDSHFPHSIFSGWFTGMGARAPAAFPRRIDSPHRSRMAGLSARP